MRKKYFFFDIDGTLTNANPGGVILPSTFKTLDALRANGHFVSIATGRSQRMALPFAKEVGIENMVTDGGHGLTINNEVISIRPLDKEKALEVIHECVVKDRAFCVAVDNTVEYYGHNNNFDQKNWLETMPATIKVIPDLDYTYIKEIHKIFIALTPEEEHSLTSIHGDLGFARYNPGYIIVEPEDKFLGIRSMMEYLNAPLEDVVVFGDARNDIGMITEAATSIAMGNAIPELKEIATFVTKDCTDDGIEYACKHFGWI